MPAATIRLQALGATWETLGADRRAGVWFEGLSLQADEWGPSRASFSVKRAPGMPWPDLSAFTPAEIEVGGIPVWSGRISDTPTQDGRAREISVQCEGWQYHLDDDLYEKAYVHTDASAWADTRGFLTTDLPYWPVPGKVSTGSRPMIGWAKGDPIGLQHCVGITLDLGPAHVLAGDVPTSLYLDYTKTGGQADTYIYARTGVAPSLNSGSWGEWSQSGLSLNSYAANGTVYGTFGVSNAGRYVNIFVYYSGAGGTFGTDIGLRLNEIRVFTNNAYSSSGTSVLKASTVAADVVTRATTQLSADLSGIGATVFNMPSCVTGLQTARASWQAADAYHDWVKQVDVYKRPVYKAKPSVATLEIGSWSAAQVADQSANSGEEIYNRGILTGQDPGGNILRSARSGETGSQYFTTTTSTGWSGLASGFLGPNLAASGNNTPTFYKGVAYAVRIVSITTATSGGTWEILIGSPFDSDTVSTGAYPNVWPNPYTGPSPWFTWTPTANRGHFGLSYYGRGLPLNNTLCTLIVEAYSLGTIPDRRGFQRSKALSVSNALPTDLVAANVIADTWMRDHRTTPFKGTISGIGKGAMRDPLTGQDIGPSRLLLKTQELVRFGHIVDPDTGSLGRDGRLVNVTYDHASNTAQATFDNSRASFEALMARLAVLQPGS